VLGPFHYAFVQRGALELLFLSVGAGVLGTWIVLRSLAFYAHGVATAAFPGLVLAAGLGFAAPLGAVAAAVVFAGSVEGLGGRRRSANDTHTALVLVGALALGVILASDVFRSQASVEALLFGSVLAVGNGDLALAAAMTAVALAAAALFGKRWLAAGFDAGSARGLGLRTRATDALLLLIVALAVISSLAAVGVMLAGALYVIPAATTRLWFRTLGRWQLATVALAAAESIAGLWLAVETNVPPGAAIAVLAGGVFAVAALSRARVAVAMTAGALLLSGCVGAPTHKGVLVVATTTQLGDFARAVGGRAVTVHQLLHPNTDPHEYEPRPSDVIATSGAGVVLESGLDLDGWMGKVVDRAGGHPAVVDVGASAPVQREDDPHWWHDPRNAEAAVRTVEAALIRADPARRSTFRRNAARYELALHRLDAELRGCFERVPRGERKLVTSHDAFAYFAHRYGIAVVGAVIPSQTSEAQPSAGDVADLIRLIRREQVKAVFPESSINTRLAEQIARETGATAAYRLYGDTLGPGQTYLSMERANADAMMRGFTGGREGCT
jgi:ABC-type Zn uptake system ZnuABC Zn-binding protein ZnuA/ABC-type Mn2+/Zn2+ transport system permease subunit